MARVRVRQHVNPLSHKYQTPIPPPNWYQIYASVTQPLHLDIGCARGKFLLQMAHLHPQINFLGVEIRQPLVDEANEHRDRMGLTNLHFLFCNINNSLSSLLESLPAGVLKWVSIQFPDPWFKQRHMKRRVVQPELVDLLATHLVEEGIVFLQSDVESVAIEMRDRFLSHPRFQQQHSELWLETNPFPVPTEREIATLAHKKPVYRVLIKIAK
ncbi:tRNA (guanosine(46)-N7)-methyltransferase TrmB [Hydrococcus rivularis NIES-593]|uniref:tRNA (guanine-N(7)-)-methyltransferase n=1 Tax=Hydrococcus rivularis NIES-593 TaxID=1921803 RepID=A0A1U7HT67_9CYAN|nr:tRNA (guanosine(46)-N7)-methyltransferase TrmB [Hydrococcus rivularis]OKH26759.1 tRNA (guanosine(46)-N7)-methyltransferase TrmB [Hydrococcus rivularis NIES-593]